MTVIEFPKVTVSADTEQGKRSFGWDENGKFYGNAEGIIVLKGAVRIPLLGKIK